MDCGRGHLWTASYVAENEGYQDIDVESPGIPRDHPTYDTVVEVIDIENGRVLASERFNTTLGPFQGTLHVVEPFLALDLTQGFNVLSLSLDLGAR
jgi:hypothetical protein